MDGVIDFVVANYQWVILGVVLFIMLIVGYVADKTDFGRKKKNKNIEVPSNEINVDSLQGKTLNDMLSQNAGVNEVGLANEDLNVPFGDAQPSNNIYQSINEDLNAPFGDNSNNKIEPKFETNKNVMNDIPANFSEISNEDLNVPLGDVVSNNSNTNVTDVQTSNVFSDSINEDLNAPLGDTNMSVNGSTETISETIPNETQESIFSAPEINNNINEEQTNSIESQEATYEQKVVPEVITEQLGDQEVSSVDDIWKF